MLDQISMTVSAISAVERPAAYDSAFLRDPDGRRVEAVRHLAP